MIDSLINTFIKIFYLDKASIKLVRNFEKFFLIYFLLVLFFWNVDYKLFDAKHLTSIVFILSLFCYPKNLKYLKIPYVYLLIFFFLVHFCLISFHSGAPLIKENFVYYFYLMITIFTVILLFDFFKENLNKIIILFYFIFNSFYILFLTIYIMQNGYLYLELEGKNLIDCYGGIFSETGFIFKENSHFGLMSSAVILYSSNALLENQIRTNKKIFIINSIFFFIISLTNISTSFLVTLLVLSFILLIKNKSLKKRIFYIFLILCSVFFLNFKEQCKYRSIDNVQHFVKSFSISKTKNIKDVKDVKVQENALSYRIFINSIKVGIFSLPQNLFGVGINNYNQLFEKYNKDDEINFLNTEDASNNFVKIIAEFGLFGLVFYFFLLFRIIKINPSNSMEIFLITLIIAQSIRGVGYFAAAFALIVIIYIISINDKNFNTK